MWKRDISYSIEGVPSVGDPLVYPYHYDDSEYIFGGRAIYSIEVNNEGRETGCIVSITNNGETPLTEVEWFIENTYKDAFGNDQTTIQRSKWFTQEDKLTLYEGYTLIVNSNPTTQEAKVVFTDGTSQSVVSLQEPSWDYINFVTVKNGVNRIVFYVDNPDVKIDFSYSEQKELI